ncbi:hypothetical protein FN846DRAFT_889531 [Sphaerosporella brunnea]|uniref:Uncharacterized protein n=1 Tax=Sphaerosporella brunnea TaxID=1250544 RepID=A0A5J5EZM5_9PEZI|nr:hypothetical protein FN846DRAFT_889531 [Sphaerosporella brunnea]
MEEEEEQHLAPSGSSRVANSNSESDEELEAYLDSILAPPPTTPQDGLEPPSKGLGIDLLSSESLVSNTSSWIDLPRFDGSSGSTVKRKYTSSVSSALGAQPTNIEGPQIRTAEALLSFRGIAKLRANRSKARIVAGEESPGKRSWNSWGHSPRRSARPKLRIETASPKSSSPSSSSSSAPSPETSSGINTPAERNSSPQDVSRVGVKTPVPIVKSPGELASPVSDDDQSFQLAEEVVLVPVLEVPSKGSSVKTERSPTPSEAPISTLSDESVVLSNGPHNGLQQFLELNPVTSPALECNCAATATEEVGAASESDLVAEMHSSVPVVEVTIEHRDTPPGTPVETPSSSSRALNHEAQVELDTLMRQLIDALMGIGRLAARQENPRELVLVFAVVGYRLWLWFLDGLASRVGARLQDPQIEPGKQ